MRQQREAIQHMQDHHPGGLANRGEVVHAIPLRDQLQVGAELATLPGRGFDRHGSQSRLDRLVEVQALFSIPAPRRFKCTSRSEIAAGVMPWMRAAWPIVSGRCWESFCCASRESPRTDR